MKSYIKGIIAIGSIVFHFFFVFSGQTNFELSRKMKFYKSKGWMRALMTWR